MIFGNPDFFPHLRESRDFLVWYSQILGLNILIGIDFTKTDLSRFDVSGHLANIIPNVYVISFYWEFVDNSGYLRQDFYDKMEFI